MITCSLKKPEAQNSPKAYIVGSLAEKAIKCESLEPLGKVVFKFSRAHEPL